jgi:hypothetical protein
MSKSTPCPDRSCDLECDQRCHCDDETRSAIRSTPKHDLLRGRFDVRGRPIIISWLWRSNPRGNLIMLVYRVSHPDNDLVVDVDSIAAIERVMRSAKPGRYLVDEISSDPLPSGHTSRRWGVVINHADGTVTMDPDPWQNC